jgi:asparagine synthase (glutamine-hydrolysing)
LLTGIKRPGETIYRDLYEVPPGQVIEWSAAGCSARTYWRLQPGEHRDDLPTTASTIRDLLAEIVADQLVADVPVCTLLSGGLDSSAVTALAAATLTGQHAGPVRSFAVDFTGHSSRFVPDRIWPTADAPYVHALAEHVGSSHTDIVLSSGQLADPASRVAVLDAMDAPVGGSDGYTSLYLLFGAIREHSTVALSGEGADEVFGGYLTFHNPGLVSAPTFPWLAAGPRPYAPARLLPRPLADRLDLRSHVRSIYREALAAVPHPGPGDQREQRMREITYLHLTYFLPRLLDRKDRLSMAHGLEVRVPYCDHRLVNYLYNAPWSMKACDGREKSLLRAARPRPAPARRRRPPQKPLPPHPGPGLRPGAATRTDAGSR